MNEKYSKPADDYLRTMTASPEVKLGDPNGTVASILEVYNQAKDSEVELLVLPELCITGYSTADLFFNRHVLNNSMTNITKLKESTTDGPVVIVGAPIKDRGILYNCAVVLAEGEIKGIVPKSYLPNYNEFYEKRWFTSGKDITGQTLQIDNVQVPFGTDLLFNINGTSVGIEICEDAWAPIPPSSYAALAGAEVIVNISASNELIGKTEYRRDMISNLAAKLSCAYVYTSAGDGESTADLAFGGHQMVIENGSMLGEIKPFNSGTVTADIDRTEITTERLVNKTFADQANEIRNHKHFRMIPISVKQPSKDVLLRNIEPHPFVPANPEKRDERCKQLFELMGRSLARRVKESNAKGLVIGLSGGLDSTLALLTSIYASKLLGKDASFIHTLTMPGLASSERTQDNASILAVNLGTTHGIIRINSLSNEALLAIEHNTTTEDITYENTQARMRTLLLMNYANKTNSIVVGTGDMSESAQGWCTYNGDHMSMYNPNTSIPKTLVRHLVKWFSETQVDEETKKVLDDIMDTPVSPELTGNGNLDQTTEDILGPYELHDFFLYHQNRRHEDPSKTGYLAINAFEGLYDQQTIVKWLNSFLKRYTSSQWKRDVMPNGPKAGTVSLSPRGDLRLPPNLSPDWYK